MTRSFTSLRCSSTPYLPPKARANILHTRAFPLPSYVRQVSASEFLRGDGFLALHPSTQPDGKSRFHCAHVRADAAVKAKKPPFKPASRGIVLAAIFLPLAMAGTAVAVGRILLAKIQKEAYEEADEWEKRFSSTRLLSDGLTDEERILEQESSSGKESTCMPTVRSRPKREE